ncbi:MAG: hypothetical protein Fur005_03300 [Roseiflexaceae bacterium]
MHDRIVVGYMAREWSSSTQRDLQTFAGYAAELGLNRDVLQSCVVESRHAAQIEADVRSAIERGINSTPAFLVNGRPVLGALPFERWQQLFDSLLTQP